MKGFKAKFYVDETVPPKAHSVPYANADKGHGGTREINKGKNY